MRALAPLILLIALAAPFGDAGPRSLPAAEACVPAGSIHSSLGPGAGEEGSGGGQRIQSFGVATSGPAEGATGPGKGPRRDLTAALRRALPTPAVFATTPPLGSILSAEGPLGTERTGFTAHPSTAPPRQA